MKKISVCLLLCVASTAAVSSAALPFPQGAMLRQGEWLGGAGSYSTPAIWGEKPVKTWPERGWAILNIDEAASTLAVRPLAPDQAMRVMKPIRDQLLWLESQPGRESLEGTPSEPPKGTEGDLYVWVPGVKWAARAVPLYRFSNGTPRLRPHLDRRYALTHAGKAFAFRLQNGLRTADGRPYGSGAQFTLELDQQRFDYDLGGYGWDVSLLALGDFDGDGKPDFLFALGDSSSGHEALVLSSKARPGKNPPTAYLSATGC